MPWSDPVATAGFGLVTAIIAAAGTWWAIRHAHRIGLLDSPGDRRSHTVATPRGGGVGIAAACILAIVAIALNDAQPVRWMLPAIGLAIVAAVGWRDDHRPFSAWPRLAVHAAAAGLLAASLLIAGASPARSAAGFVLALGLVNAWNFMDGINGLAASQAALCGLGLAAVIDSPGAQSFGIALACSCLAFLPFNFPRARTFLGDVGSGTLGYSVACLLAWGLASNPSRDWPLLLLAPLAMLMDSGLTLLGRMRRRERWWEPHVQHVYQRCSKRHGHSLVTLAYALWTLTSIGVMLSLQGRPIGLGVVALLSCALAASLAWRWLHRRHIEHTEGFGS